MLFGKVPTNTAVYVKVLHTILVGLEPILQFQGYLKCRKGDSLNWSLYGAMLNTRKPSPQGLPTDRSVFQPLLKGHQTFIGRCTTRASSHSNTCQVLSVHPNSSEYAGHWKYFSDKKELAERCACLKANWISWAHFKRCSYFFITWPKAH